MENHNSLDGAIEQELQRLQSHHLLRRLRPWEEHSEVINFGGNNYLGLASHPAVIEAAVAATRAHGTGAGASRLVSGTSRKVMEFEEMLAAWKEKPAALLFSSGYAAALGTIPTLISSLDVVILDKLCHASLIDGAKLSGATVRVFPHNRMDRLESILKRIRGTSNQAKTKILIVTESIFSMDGDSAYLSELVDLKQRFGAWLMVDEAHSTGLYGSCGAGLISEMNLTSSIDVILGTLSKALGGLGGYIAGSQALIDRLINGARSFIYSTALPPGVVAAGLAAMQIAQSEEGTTLRSRLWSNVAHFLEAVSWPRNEIDSGCLSVLALNRRAIQPFICGDEEQAMNLASQLFALGLYVPGIRFPTVARGRSRLRLTMNAACTTAQIDHLAKALHSIWPKNP